MKIAILAAVPLAFAAACSAGPAGRQPGETAQFARSLVETATVAAVARRDAQVCREMRVGIAERDWVRGVVLEADGARVRIRIDEPGKFQHSIGGNALTRGAVVSDDALTWTPCR